MVFLGSASNLTFQIPSAEVPLELPTARANHDLRSGSWGDVCWLHAKQQVPPKTGGASKTWSCVGCCGINSLWNIFNKHTKFRMNCLTLQEVSNYFRPVIPGPRVISSQITFGANSCIFSWTFTVRGQRRPKINVIWSIQITLMANHLAPLPQLQLAEATGPKFWEPVAYRHLRDSPLDSCAGAVSLLLCIASITPQAWW